MGKNSKIGWTTHTANAWWGCNKVSPECDNCYAESFSKRLGLKIWGQDAPRKEIAGVWKNVSAWNRAAESAGERARVFWESEGDILENHAALDELRPRVWKAIDDAPALDHILLTKRPQNYVKMLPREWLDNPRPNVWLMTTVGVQSSLWRAEALAKVPAAVRGLSMEPLLEYVDIRSVLPWMDWIIVGGESGHKARPFHINWARALFAQCRTAEKPGVAYFLKQLGARPIMDEAEAVARGVALFKGKRYPDLPAGTVLIKCVDPMGENSDEWPLGLSAAREFPGVARAAAV